MTYSMFGSGKPQFAYNNAEAHIETKGMMVRNEKINVRLGQDVNNHPYAWVDSKSKTGYKLLLNSEELTWLTSYLNVGESDDLNTNPDSVEPYSESKRFDEDMLKQLIDGGKAIKTVPLFRESPEYVSATALYRYGTISFRMKRTEELLDYLREKSLL